MPIYEYNCLAHGKFDRIMKVDDPTPDCPHGCSSGMVKKVVTVPAFHDGRTANIDRNLRNIADDFGVTDLNNQNGTSSCVRPDWKMKQAELEMQKMMASGQTYSAEIPDSGINSLGIGGESFLTSPEVKNNLSMPKPIVQASWDGKL